MQKVEYLRAHLRTIAYLGALKLIQKRMYKVLALIRANMRLSVHALTTQKRKTKSPLREFIMTASFDKTAIAQSLSISSAFVSQAARLSAKGATPGDVKSVLRFATEGNCEFVQGAFTGETVQGMHNQKAIKRLAQGVAFVAGDMLGGFDKATALIVAAIAQSKDKIINFQNMRFAMGGVGSEDTAAIKGVSRARLNRFIGTISNEGTRVSQCSRTVGTGGFFAALGIVRSVDKHSFEVINANHPFLIAYAMRLNNMGDGTFALLTEEK